MAQQEQHQIIIGVMGMTGTGKSTFINTLTKDPNIVVGKRLRSRTIPLNVYLCNPRAHYSNDKRKLIIASPADRHARGSLFSDEIQGL